MRWMEHPARIIAEDFRSAEDYPSYTYDNPPQNGKAPHCLAARATMAPGITCALANVARMRFRLRTAANADVDDLLALWLEAAENESRPADTREAVVALLSRDADAVIVAEAEHDGPLIGSIIAGWDG